MHLATLENAGGKQYFSADFYGINTDEDLDIHNDTNEPDDSAKSKELDALVASGNIATVAVDVWILPPLSVSGTRWTRCGARG